MLGILVILLISWVLLWFFEGRSLMVLGILPAGRRFIQFLVGFILTALLCAAIQCIEGWQREAGWSLNADFSLTSLLRMLWWDFRSAY
ncbi:hypothetical protein AB9P05_23150 [Roseivirga sp. BDSF3-8]|uniref:hypothetical protein n=1 Tax=Roseivirga sp. BDSF3-8 TaxID=3241598 RepID=UPI003531E5E9